MVMSFSAAKNSAQKAADLLDLKFNSPQLMIPVIYQEINNISPARNEAEVPRITEGFLRKVESLSVLTKNDDKTLPSDIILAIFGRRKKRCFPTLAKMLK